jgi:hypothetical protein
VLPTGFWCEIISEEIAMETVTARLWSLCAYLQYFLFLFPSFNPWTLPWSVSWSLPAFEIEVLTVFNLSWKGIQINFYYFFFIFIVIDGLTLSFSCYDIILSLFSSRKSSPSSSSAPSRFTKIINISWNWLLPLVPKIHIECNQIKITSTVSSETSFQSTAQRLSFQLHNKKLTLSIAQIRLDGNETQTMSSQIMTINGFRAFLDLHYSLQSFPIVEISVASCALTTDLTLINLYRDLVLISSCLPQESHSPEAIAPAIESLRAIFTGDNESSPSPLSCDEDKRSNSPLVPFSRSQLSLSFQFQKLEISCGYFQTIPINRRHILAAKKRRDFVSLLDIKNLFGNIKKGTDELNHFKESVKVLILPEGHPSWGDDLSVLSAWSVEDSSSTYFSLDYVRVFDPDSSGTLVSSSLSIFCTTHLPLLLPLEMLTSGLFLYHQTAPLFPSPPLRRQENVKSQNPPSPIPPSPTVTLSFSSAEVQIQLPSHFGGGHGGKSGRLLLRELRYNDSKDPSTQYLDFSVESVQLSSLSMGCETEEMILNLDSAVHYSQTAPRDSNSHSIPWSTFLFHQEQTSTMNFDYWWNWMENSAENSRDQSILAPRIFLSLGQVIIHFSGQNLPLLCSLATSLAPLLRPAKSSANIYFDSNQPFLMTSASPLLRCASATLSLGGVMTTLSNHSEFQDGSLALFLPPISLEQKTIGKFFSLSTFRFVNQSPCLSYRSVNSTTANSLLSFPSDPTPCCSSVITSLTRPLIGFFCSSSSLHQSTMTCLIPLSTVVEVHLPAINLHLDTLPCSLIGEHISTWKQQTLWTQQWLQSYLGITMTVVFPKLRLRTLPLLSRHNLTPFRVMRLSIDSIHLRLTYDRQPLGIILFSDLKFNSLKLLLSQLTQTSGRIHDLSIFEMSEHNSLYQHILLKVKDGEDVPANGEKEEPIIKFHLTQFDESQPILEIVTTNLRLVYLQRAVMTIISYLRDIIPSNLFKKLPHHSASSLPILSIPEMGDDPFVHKLFSPARSGIFRFSWTVFNSEVHLPINSSGDDALVFIFRHLSLYRLSPAHEILPFKEYSLGLFTSSRPMWISEESRIDDLLSLRRRGRRFLPDWQLIKYADSHLSSPQVAILEDEFETHLSINLHDCLICSWCSDNLIAKSQSIHCLLTIQSIMPSVSGIYPTVFDHLGFRSQAIMNCFVIDLTAESVDWVLSRGQYMTIVYLIQQNFPEFMKVIPPLLAPPAQKIELKKTIHRKWCVEDRYPLFLAVPLDIAFGKIHLVENNDSYFKHLFATHDSNFRRLQISVESRREELESFAAHWIRDRTRRTASSALSQPALFSVPHTSRHSQFRGLFLSCTAGSHFPLASENATPGIDDSILTDEPHPSRFESLAFIFFSDLHFNVVRRHQGGGMSLETLATRFIVTKGSQMSSDDDFFDTDEIQEPLDPLEILYEFEDISPEITILSQRRPMHCQEESQEQEQKQRHRLSPFAPSVEEHSIFYSQNGVGNLRRCFIDLSDTILSTHLLEITKLINFFVESITLADLREKQYISSLIPSQIFNYRALLDVEVYLQRLLVFIPSDLNEIFLDTKGLCLEIEQFQYLHSWRGFLEHGPGWIAFDIQSDVNSYFISTLWDIYQQDQSNLSIESLLDPIQIEFHSHFTLYPSALNNVPNSDILNRVENFYPRITITTLGFLEMQAPPPRLEDDYLQSVHQMVLAIKPYPRNETVCLHESNRIELGTKSMSSGIQAKLSLLDVTFIMKLFSSLNHSYTNRNKRGTVFETFPVLFSSFHDITHLPRLYDILSYAILEKTSSLPLPTNLRRTSEFIANFPGVEIILHNNSYGMNLMQFHFMEPKLSYVSTKSGINSAISGCLKFDIYNPKLSSFDSTVESIKFIAVCATDLSSGSVNPHQALSNNLSHTKLRFDVSCEPIEVNVAFNTLSNLIHNISLGDVVTSRSSKLPVYRVVNLLGVPVHCKFFLQTSSAAAVASSRLGSLNRHFRIIKTLEVNQTFALDTRLQEHQHHVSTDECDLEGHCIHIRYSLDNMVEFVAMQPTQMDSQGDFEVILQPKQCRNGNQSSDSNYEEVKRVYSQSCGDTSTSRVKILIGMKVVDSEGTRELTLKSIFSMTNDTLCPISLIAHLNVITAEKYLKPSEEWFLPVTIISQYTNIWMVLQSETPLHQKRPLEDEDNEVEEGSNSQTRCPSVSMQYVNMFPSLYSFLHGNETTLSPLGWVDSITGVATIRLKSQLVSLTHNWSYDNANRSSTAWTNLIVPMPLLDTLPMIGTVPEKIKKEKYVVKYPQDHSDLSDDLETSPRGTAWKDFHHGLETQTLCISSLFPCRFSILPPLELMNLFCQPLLYRICEKGNPLNCAEGCILSGRLLQIHINPLRHLCLSVRLLNYKWSTWIDIPIFPLTPKVIEGSMESLFLTYNSRDLKLPQLTFSFKTHERKMSLYCPLWLINRTGKTLCYREGGGFGMSSHEKDDRPQQTTEGCYLPSRGRHGIENCLVPNTSSISHSVLSQSSAQKQLRHQSSRRSLHLSMSNKLSLTSHSFTIISPFDHSKTITVTSFGSSTIQHLITTILEKNSLQGPGTRVESKNVNPWVEEFNLLDSDFNPSDYQLYFYDGVISDSLPAASKLVFREAFDFTVDASSGRIRPNANTIPHLDFQSSIGLNISQLTLSPHLLSENPLSSIPLDKRDKLILFSVYEVQAIQQIQQLTRKEKRKSSLSHFIGIKSSQYLTPFVHFKGDELPYHPKGMILSTISLSLSIQNESDWSDSISIPSSEHHQNTSAKFEKEERTSLHVIKLLKNTLPLYEYALSLQRGTGVYGDITAVTIIPRVIFQSKLPFALQIRQVILDESSSSLMDVTTSMTMGNVKEASEEVMLLPYALQQYHHKLSAAIPLLQFRQYSNSTSDIESHPTQQSDEGTGEADEMVAEEEVLSLTWSGEINVTHIGLFHIFLRQPDRILNIRVESVGVSLVVTLSLQNPKWPPYRIENKTSFRLTYRQTWKKNKRAATAITILDPFTTQPYAWDQPFNYSNEKLVLSLEFIQIGNHRITTDFPLNEIDYSQTLKLHRLLPDLSHPICSGNLLLSFEKRSSNSSPFISAFGVISEDTIYLFEDSSLTHFTAMVNLHLPLPPQETRLGVDQDFASFLPFSPKASSSLDNVLAAVGLSHRQSQSYPVSEDRSQLAVLYEERLFWDINTIRRTLLRIGSYFDLFPASKEIRRQPTATADPITSLRMAISSGVRLDELNRTLSHHPVLISDLLSALVILGEATNEAAAIFLVQEMYHRHYLQLSPYPSVHTDVSESLPFSLPLQRVPVSQIDFLTASVTIHPPSLCPEIENRSPTSDSLPCSSLDPRNLVYALVISTKRYLFQFQEEREMLKWLYALRLCIEKSWVTSLIASDIQSDGAPLVSGCTGDEGSLESYETNVCLKMYTDGPVKVLEITEDSIEESGVAASQAPQNDSSREEMTVSLYLPSFGISIIDSTPSELLYVFFKDIQLIVDSSLVQRSYVFTVEYIQIDNQLLNPLYPIAFHPTKSHLSRKTQTDQTVILLLPGLEHSRRQTLNPTVHCFIQQKLVFEGSTLSHTHLSTVDSPASSSALGGCDLLYFEHLSLWIAPLELSIDEEIIVRTLRIFTKLRSQYLLQLSSKKPILLSSLGGEPLTHILTHDTAFFQLKFSGIASYLEFSKQNQLLRAQHSQNIYIKLLEFHPIDVIVTIRSTPDFELYEAEDLYFTKMIRVDYGNLRLNALIVKNMFGVLSFILSILSAHYQNSILRQIYSLIGGTDVVEGSVGLLTNLGSGVYDLFYEPIEGLLGDEQTFMEGLSKGGKSLASKAIGGTSAFTSKITGGIGLGMAMLTLDPKYQKNREKDRLKAAQSVSEGIYVGSKEFGRNILEGVTGIVVEPYRGWVEEGGIGFGIGLARGIIGVALKPAVGVFDLASRTTEGIKHSAFNNFLEANNLTISGRIRFPRQFGARGELLPYHWALPSLQIILDRLTNPIRHRKFCVVSYLAATRRKLLAPQFPARQPPPPEEDILNRDPLVDPEPLQATAVSSTNFSNEDLRSEIHGYAVGQQSIAVVCQDSILLLHVDHISREQSNRQWKKVRLVWKCPSNAIEQFQSHPNGDIILLLKEIPGSPFHSVLLSNSLHSDDSSLLQSSFPTLHDAQLIDYYLFQEILEKLFQSYELARMHPLVPSRDLSSCVQLHRKRTGLKRFMKNSTKHEYRLHQFVLYEFTEFEREDELSERRLNTSEAEDDRKRKSPSHAPQATADVTAYQADSDLGDILQTYNGNEILFSSRTKIGQFISEAFLRQAEEADGPEQGHVEDEEKQEELSDEDVIPDIYDRESESDDSSSDLGGSAHEQAEAAGDGRVMVLTAAIPLIDIRIHGPDLESSNSHGEKTYALTLKRRNIKRTSHSSGGSSLPDVPLDFIKRDDMSSLLGLQTNRLRLSSRESVKLLFADQVTAQHWKIYLSESSLSSTHLSSSSSGTHASLTAEPSSGSSDTKLVSISSLSQRVTEVGVSRETGAEYRSLPNGRALVIPCGGGDIEEIESFKIEIARNLCAKSNSHFHGHTTSARRSL